MSRSACLAVIALAFASAAVVVVEAAVEVYPETVRLASRRSRVQLVITAREADGRLRDVTHRAKVSSSAPALATVRAGRVSPSGRGADGRTVLRVVWQGETVEVPVVVSNLVLRRGLCMRGIH